MMLRPVKFTTNLPPVCYLPCLNRAGQQAGRVFDVRSLPRCDGDADLVRVLHDGIGAFIGRDGVYER